MDKALDKQHRRRCESAVRHMDVTHKYAEACAQNELTSVSQIKVPVFK